MKDYIEFLEEVVCKAKPYVEAQAGQFTDAAQLLEVMESVCQMGDHDGEPDSTDT